MSSPIDHADRSVRRWGGQPADYLAIHQWFGSPQEGLPNKRRRLLRHTSFGIALAEQVFGERVVNSAARQVPVRAIGRQHVLKELGRVPTLAECSTELPGPARATSPRRALAGADVLGTEPDLPGQTPGRPLQDTRSPSAKRNAND